MAARMNIQAANALLPRWNRALRSDIVAACHYPLHGDANERLNTSAPPNLTSVGSGATEWSATYGAYTPNGTTQYLTGPASNAIHNAILNMRTLRGQEIIIAFEHQFDGDLASPEMLVWWGRNTAAGGTAGAFGLELTGSEQVMLEARASLGSTLVTTAFPNSGASATSARRAYVVSLRSTDGIMLDGALWLWTYGTGLVLNGAAVSVDMTEGGTLSAPGPQTVDPLAVCVRKGSASFDRSVNSGGGGGASFNNLQMVRLSAPVTGLAERAIAALGANPRDLCDCFYD